MDVDALPTDGGLARDADPVDRPGPEGGKPLPSCTNQACTEANQGLAAVCARTTGRCVPLLTPECWQVEGPYQQDEAFFVGIFDGKWEAAVLAASEINHDGPGLPAPSGQPRRPLVLLRCSADPIDLPRVMDHLITDLALPGVIPPRNTDSVIAISQRSVPAVQFMLAPFSAAALTHLADEGLLWHVGVSQGLLTPAMALSVADVEAKLRADGLTGPLRVALVTADVPQNTVLADAVLSRMTFNGHAALDPENAENLNVIKHSGASPVSAADFAARAEQVLSAAPHVVVGIGGGDSVGLALELEAHWTRKDYRPEYVLSTLNRDPFWLPQITPELARRMRGVYSPDRGPAYPGFVKRYEARYGALPRLAALMYDTLYAFAYAAAAATAEGPITGRALSRGMTRLVPPGPVVDVGTGDGASTIQQALSRLSAGEGIDLRGVTGNLDYDLATGEPSKEATPVEIWCVGDSSDGAQYLDAGRHYDSAMDALAGEFSCPPDGDSVALP